MFLRQILAIRMSITFGSNISSLKAQRQLGKVTSEIGTVFERLSSGLRINSASDDAAGLAVSSGLDADRRIYSQGIRNLNDGIGLLNVADGAVEQLVGIVTRLSELAEQAANGTYGVSQRAALDKEAQALSTEYTRIVQSTSFNGQSLFNAAFGSLKVQGGFGANGGIQSTLGGAVGTGSFAASTSFATETGATTASRDVALGDLNGDGFLDIVSAGGISGGQNYATVRLGTGTGSFGTAVSYAIETSATTGLELGDLNGDGILDIVTGGIGGGVGRTTIRLGVGDGTFGAAVSYTMDATTTDNISLGDFNADGFLDVISGGTGGGVGITTVRLGAGDGTLGNAVTYQMSTGGTYTVGLSDLNNDGILDIVAGGYGAGSQIATRLGNGDGTFRASVSLSTAEVDGDISFGDLNGDGNVDVFYGGSTGPGAGKVAVLYGTGSGTFVAGVSFSGGHNFDTAIADLNGDGRADLIDVSRTELDVRFNLGNGSFSAAVSYGVGTGGQATSFALGDLDRNGVSDLVIAGSDGSSIGSASVSLQNSTNGLGPLLPFNIRTRADALQALPQFDQALSRLTVQRGVIGAFQSRIETAVNTLSIATEGYRAAVSQITDADVAIEAAGLVRNKILQQAAGAVLAQANQQPALALKLLQGPGKK